MQQRAASGTSSLLPLAVLVLALSALGPGCGDPKSDKAEDEDTEQRLLPDAGADAGNGGGAREPFLKILAPQAGKLVLGHTEVLLDYQVPQDLKEMSLVFDGHPLALPGLAGALSLDTRAVAEGTHELLFEMRSEAGEVWSDRVEFVIDNPGFGLVSSSLDALSYTAGKRISLDLEYDTVEPLAFELELIAPKETLVVKVLTVQSRGDGHYHIDMRLPSELTATGRAALVVHAEDRSGEATRDSLELGLQAAPRIPLVVEGGVYVDLPLAPMVVGVEGAPAIVDVTGNSNLNTGGTADIELSWTQKPERRAQSVVVSVAGFHGYYVVPAPGQGDATTITLSLPELPPELDGQPLEVLLSAVNAAQETFETVVFPIMPIILDLAGVRVSVVWDTPADVDLHVLDPSGTLINWETPVGMLGSLDLDSNPECMLDLTNIESIGFPSEAQPIGEYTVYVNLFDSCNQGEVNYRVTVQACGRLVVHSGHMTAADQDNQGPGRQVTKFVVDCSEQVAGQIRFEKREGGIGNLQRLPAQEVTVQAVSTRRPGHVLGETTTNAKGDYELRFPNPEFDGYVIRALAEWNTFLNPDFGASVVGFRGQEVHHADSEAVEAGTGLGAITGSEQQFVRPVVTRDLLVAVGDGSGAFNILRGMRTGYLWALVNVPAQVQVGGRVVERDAALGRVLGRFEQNGIPPTTTRQTLFNDSRSPPAILFRSESHHDEFDDSIVLHEFMHHVLRRFSFEGPEIPHGSFGMPDIAFSEGLASGLGQIALNSPNFRDTRVKPGVGLSVEFNTDLEGQFWTSNGGNPAPLQEHAPVTMQDIIHEGLVGGLIWDLMDGKNDDKIDGTRLRPVALNALFRYLPNLDEGKANSRGGVGIDAADLIDGWRCFATNPLDPAGSFQQDDDLQQMLSELGYPYDYPDTGMLCL